MQPLALFKPVDRRNVRVIERSQQLRFTPEARQPLGIQYESLRQNFDGNLAPQIGIVGYKNLLRNRFKVFGVGP